DKYGGLPFHDLSERFDRDYLLMKGVTVSWFSNKGTFAIKRDPWNSGRGDKASVAKRKKSIQTIGFVTDARGGADLIQNEDLAADDEYYACHYATICEGVAAAAEEDVNRSNPHVQYTLKLGLPGCKIYRRQTPIWGRKWLKHKGNMLNEEMTRTTIIEIWAMTAEVTAAFKRREDKLRVTGAPRISQAALDSKKLNFANQYACGPAADFMEQWSSYHTLENMTTFYKDANQFKLIAEPDVTFWQRLQKRILEEADLSVLRDASHEKIGVLANDIFKAFKKTTYIDRAIDLVLMLFKKAAVGSEPKGWGACSLLPQGLPPLKVAPLKNLRELVIATPRPSTTRGTPSTRVAAILDLQAEPEEQAVIPLELQPDSVQPNRAFIEIVDGELEQLAKVGAPKQTDKLKDADVMNNDQLVALMAETEIGATTILKFFESPWKQPLALQPHVGNVMNMSMLSMFTAAQDNGGYFSDADHAFNTLVEKILQQIDELLPEAALQDCLKVLIAAEAPKRHDMLSGTFAKLAGIQLTPHLASTVRSQIFFHVLSNLGLQSYMRGAGGNAMPKVYLSNLVRNGITQLLDKFDLSKESTRKDLPTFIYELEVATGNPWSKVMREFADQLQKCSNITLTTDGIKFKNDLALKDLGVDQNAQGMPKIHPVTIDLYPSDKASMVKVAISEILKKNPEFEEAMSIESGIVAVAYSRIQPKVSNTAEDSTVITVAGDGNVKNAAQYTTLQTWFEKVVERESNDDNIEWPSVFLRILSLELGAQLARAHLEYCNLPDGAAECNLVPMVISLVDSPAMFVESNGFVNQQRSDCSMPWYIKPLPAPEAPDAPRRTAGPKAKAKAKPAAGKSSAREKQRAAAQSKAGKKKRLGIAAAKRLLEAQKKKEVAASERQALKKKVATHRIKYAEMEPIVIAGTTYKYSRPILVNKADDNTDDTDELFRERTAWDDAPKEKKRKVDTTPGFAE
ncbi:unnamed protein product, partial [Prorocentrum cordatum]